MNRKAVTLPCKNKVVIAETVPGVHDCQFAEPGDSEACRVVDISHLDVFPLPGITVTEIGAAKFSMLITTAVVVTAPCCTPIIMSPEYC